MSLSCLLSHQLRFEPVHQFVEIHLPSGDGNNKIIDGFVVWDIQPVPTTVDQYLDKEPGCSLITVGETVIADHAV
jgi:hypothetical protein